MTDAAQIETGCNNTTSTANAGASNPVDQFEQDGPCYAVVSREPELPSPTTSSDVPWGETSLDSDQLSQANEPPRRVIPLPEPYIVGHRSQLLQQWEGTVQEVNDEKFRARLRDLTDPEHIEEQATFEFEEVPDCDHPLLAPGAVFYWSIGYRVEPHGQKSLMSSIRFRRLPAWTASDVDRAKRHASRFQTFFADDR